MDGSSNNNKQQINSDSQPLVGESIDSFPSLPSPTASQVEINNVPQWAQFLVRNQQEMQKKMEAQETELKVQSGKLQLFQKLLEENKDLKAQLEAANARIRELESQNPTKSSEFEDITTETVDQDILFTGTCESIHSISHEEREKRKAEIEAKNQQQQQQDEEKQMRQSKQSDNQQKQKQQQKQRRQQKPKPSEKDTTLSYAKIATTGPTAYKFVYMGVPRRALHSEIRKALNLIGIAKERIIDIQFPTHGIVGILVHASYEKEVRELLTQAKLAPKDEFNPTAASTIGNPTLLATLSEEECTLEAKKLYQERMFEICSRMHKKHFGIAILRHFTSLPKEDQHHVDSEYWTKFQEKYPKPIYNKRPRLDTIEDARYLLSGNNGNNNDGSEPMQGL
ncbi:hypothetical protein BDA99DRAFT_566233 [Phascolomyces articulosus]|uniref:Uncharacterized protein n=1 Tax=Phascolomyces articulosus TaxID=60185 RepID=A0AAD5P8Q1_9FUNG|nr:hypothetical protein BDA99DRAFT_566233 [Phascolomyces articulosus]